MPVRNPDTRTPCLSSASSSWTGPSPPPSTATDPRPVALIRETPGNPRRTAIARSRLSTSMINLGVVPTNSVTEPAATSRPERRIAAWVQIRWTSDIRWLDKTTVVPVAAHDAMASCTSKGLRRIHTRGRLIEQQQIGGAQKGLGHGQSVAHAVRIPRVGPVDGRAQPGHSDGFVEIGKSAGQTHLPDAQVEVSPAGEMGHKARTVHYSANPTEHFGPGSDLVPEEERTSGRGPDQSEEYP